VPADGISEQLQKVHPRRAFLDYGGVCIAFSWAGSSILDRAVLLRHDFGLGMTGLLGEAAVRPEASGPARVTSGEGMGEAWDSLTCRQEGR